MNAIENFGAAERVSITVLVDNKADLIVRSDERVKYFEDAPLLAEHGFSALVRLDEAFTLLWDAGVSPVALVENMRRMRIEPAAIDKMALSHGHLDHYAAMTDVLTAMDLLTMDKEWQQQPDSAQVQRWVESHRKTLVAHPAAFRERWSQKDDGGLVGPYEPPPRGAWEAAGVKLVLSADPYQLAPGCWTSGYVPRRSFEDSGRPKKLLYREGDAFLKDDLEDDQAVVINVKGHGLVVLSGCAHAGILNTVEYAREISGVEQVLSIIGGFHLARAGDEDIQRTIDHLRSLNPRQVVPCHCTGLKAMCQFALQMPEQFIEGVVGATYTFG